MDIREIEQLVRLLERSQISSLEVAEGETRIKVEKQQYAPLVNPTELAPETVSPAPPMAAATVNTAPLETAAPTGKAVKSPMVGVFYAAPSPEEEAFVKVGDRVKKGDVLCIIEAMKLMNEITAEADGEISAVCAENGDVVEFGQVMFYIV